MRVARRFIGLHLGKAVKMTAYEMISSIILPTLFDEEPKNDYLKDKKISKSVFYSDFFRVK